MARWAEVTGRPHVLVPHDDATGNVDVAAYLRHITPDVRLATIIHTSPVTGMTVDVAAIAAAIRKVSPGCFIVVDGIQHASHGAVDLAACGIDGYAISPYKAFSRHGYGVGWASDRLTACTKARATPAATPPSRTWSIISPGSAINTRMKKTAAPASRPQAAPSTITSSHSQKR